MLLAYNIAEINSDISLEGGGENMKMILMVPVVMACATIGTIGMVFGIGKMFFEKSKQ